MVACKGIFPVVAGLAWPPPIIWRDAQLSDAIHASLMPKE
jgi:hypothetical protein